MGTSIFYYFQNQREEMRVEVLLKDTRKILKKCSKLLRQLEHNPTSHTLDTLSKEIVTGELLEHELFQLCEKEGVSPNQLRLLGHKTTFSQWRCNNNMQKHDRGHSYTDTSKESPTLTVPLPSSHPSYLTSHIPKPT